ncbi:MAG: serine hydrolase [Bacteroidota bacterium]
MRRFRLSLLSVLLAVFSVGSTHSQMYFPPLTGNQWDTIPISDLGWCQDSVDALLDYLEAQNTKSFVVLKDGRVVVEHYFGTYTQDSVWYWASAGKSLLGFLVGCAQEDGFLDINARTDQYMGTGWSQAPPTKEALIKVFHHLSMTTGLDEGVPDPDCYADTCFQYLVDAGTRWAYHNGPYRFLQPLLEAVTGNSLNSITLNRVGLRIGMGGFWFNHVRFGTARDMARFGLLTLNQGIWDNDTLLHDTAYFNAMVRPSQTLNRSYGYLWWLNGQGTFMVPGSQLVIPFDLIPNAPADMYAALGLNDQKIYVVPSESLVVVRQGNDAGVISPAVSSFDDELWGRLSNLSCAVAISPQPTATWHISPNPVSERLRIHGLSPGNTEVALYTVTGKQANHFSALASGQVLEIKVAGLVPGIYLAEVSQAGRTERMKVWVR